MPRDARELRLAWLASASAGFWEEVAYRGFLIWYLEPALGLTGAVAASTALFAVAHAYQGPKGIIFALVAGAALAGIYLATGSLLLAIWIHAAYNVASFTTGRIVLAR